MPGGTTRDRNKLSWVYRNKKRQGKIVNNQNQARKSAFGANDNHKPRIVVKNLSFQVTEEDLRNLYEPFGQIDEINVLKRPDGKPVGCAFIQFQKLEDASVAIFKTNKHEFLSRPIKVAWAIAKSHYVHLHKNEQLEPTEQCEQSEDKNDTNTTVILDNDTEGVEQKENSKNSKKKLSAEERKALKQKKKLKRARVVIRNLSFKATESDLKKHFNQYGGIVDVKFLTKADGLRTGCAFIQFDHVQSAAKAVHYSNMKVICDRPIVVDRAVPKEKFKQHEVEIKTELSDPDEIEIKQEKEDDGGVTEELGNKDEVDEDVKSTESGSSDDDNNDSDDDEEDEDDTDSEKDSDDDESENEDKNDKKDSEKEIKEEESHEERAKVISHDVREGKTIFLKNVSFSAKNEDIKASMEQFGPVYYALVCMDPLTEHSKGTAFVKFQNIEDAEKCLSAVPDLLRLHDQIMEPHRALDRNDVTNNKDKGSRMIKDSRNLYLVKEGVIVAGTPAAAGVSVADMKKRLQLEQWKSQMLKNLNMFVSRVRLVVHNLPDSVNDSILRNILKKHSGPKAVIQEARVMRDMKHLDANGIGKSKGFGFVCFTSHDDALKALRSINNNPGIFSKVTRPIVAFSIENRVIVNVKQRRIEKSRANNPLWKGNTDTNIKAHKQTSEPPIKRLKPNIDRKIHQNVEVNEFSGVKCEPGRPGKLQSNYKLKKQALLHNKVMKNENKARKKVIEKKINKSLSKKDIKPKQKQKISPDDANFNNLVNQYKNKLAAVPRTKSKWYET